MTNPTAPLPPRLRHRTSSQSFSSLPDDIIVNCLARVSHSYYHYLCLVSKSFYSLLSSPEIYVARAQIGAKEPRLYVCLLLPKATHHRWFTLYDPGQTLITNVEIKRELSLVQVKLSSGYSSAPLNATTVAVGYEIYQIGGSNNEKGSRAVYVLDCRSHTWRHGPNMMVARKDAKSCYLDGKIYVFGGSIEKEKPRNWGEVFDVKTQTWKPLPSPCDDGFYRYNKIRIFGGKLYVVAEHNKYAYDPKEGRWILDVRSMGLNGLISYGTLRPWCVIESVMFLSDGVGNCRWYNEKRGKWFKVWGLGDLFTKRACDYGTIQLVNYGGKLVIVWQIEAKDEPSVVWCAVIRLEKRLMSRFGKKAPEIWGVIERCNVVVPRVHKSYKLLSSLSVLV